MTQRASTPLPDFQTFWNAYGLKRDRMAAERVWNRLSAKDRKAALKGVPAYRADCQQRGIAMMYAQGYLSHRRWEDEPDVPYVETSSQQPSPTSQPEMEIW